MPCAVCSPEPAMVKRGSDVILCSAALLVLSPVLIVISMLIALIDGLPVLYTQERLGRQGKPFKIVKFRTMLAHPLAGAANVTQASDPRITRLGFILRRSKLDELPQILNVLRGDMSIVGPRPEAPELAKLWGERERKIILSVRPGMTDPATLELIDEEDLLARSTDPNRRYIDDLLPLKQAHYIAYVENQSFQGDLMLIARTVRTVFQRFPLLLKR
jgi:lipopolysaccharide/colanic/teichoic acid biosynthesis glycosyltransferase